MSQVCFVNIKFSKLEDINFNYFVCSWYVSFRSATDPPLPPYLPITDRNSTRYHEPLRLLAIFQVPIKLLRIVRGKAGSGWKF